MAEFNITVVQEPKFHLSITMNNEERTELYNAIMSAEKTSPFLSDLLVAIANTGINLN